MFRFLAPILGLVFTHSPAFAKPAQIVMIRHAEKPATGDQLDQQGCERAFLLPSFFETNPTVNRFGTPVAIYASQPDNAGSSERPVETIAPTAEDLGLPILDPVTRLNYAPLVQDLMSNAHDDGKTIIVSWEHDAIPGLAQALGVTVSAQNQVWPDNVFDEAWILDFTKSSATMKIIPENVMPGDNPLGGKNWKNPPTLAGPVSSSVSDICVNNNKLDAIVEALADPSLP